MSGDISRLKPTEAELSLLNILWQIGPSTVKQVHATVNLTQRSGYTTVLKILQIMHEKTLVIRDESNRAHIYSAANSKHVTQTSLLQDLATKAFGGSRSKLVMRAIGDSTSKQEIDDIRQLLDEIEQRV